MNEKLTYKDKIRHLEQVDVIRNGNENRYQRKAISDLSDEGIVFVSLGNYKYQRIEKAPRKAIDKYVEFLFKMVRSIYFNKIKPIEQYMTKEQLDELHNGGLFNE